MNSSGPKSCSRCGKQILCKADNIKLCTCSNVELSSDCRDYLKETEYDCLCNACLNELNQLVEKAHKAPNKPTENIHYYMEEGMLVFTELNHIKRGYCCKSGCRHCAYGYKR
ncbi:MAG: cysteine-rich CWC family protein [Bacteroidota bacterium]